MQELSMSTPEKLIHRIMQGDFAYLVENRPELYNSRDDDDSERARRAMPTYDDVLDLIVQQPTKITRDSLQILFKYIANRDITTSEIFSRYISSLGQKIKTIRMGTKVIQGLDNIPWEIHPETLALLAERRSNNKVYRLGDPNGLQQSVQPLASKAKSPSGPSRTARRSTGRQRLAN